DPFLPPAGLHPALASRQGCRYLTRLCIPVLALLWPPSTHEPAQPNGRPPRFRSTTPDQEIYSRFERRRMPEAKTSRMLTTPLTSRPSTTGRWRNPLVSITSAASPTVISEVAVLGFLVIHSETGDLERSEPEAAARSTSRSVRMPASQDPSMTTAEPTLAFTIMLVTSATERSADVVRTSVVMMSRSWITLALLPHTGLHRLAAAANLISVQVSRRGGTIHEFLVQ